MFFDDFSKAYLLSLETHKWELGNSETRPAVRSNRSCLRSKAPHVHPSLVDWHARRIERIRSQQLNMNAALLCRLFQNIRIACLYSHIFVYLKARHS